MAMECEEPFRVREVGTAGVHPSKAGSAGASDELLGVAEVCGRDGEGAQWREEPDRGRSLQSRNFVHEALFDQQGQRVEGHPGRGAGCSGQCAGSAGRSPSRA